MRPLGNIERDLRIDFFRGVALLMIFANHTDLLGGQYFVRFTTKYFHFGFSDFGEVFIFLSGYVVGLVYLKVLVERGFWMCQAKAIHRATQLYWMTLFTTTIVLAISAAFYVGAGTVMDTTKTQIFFDDPITASLLIPFLAYTPHFLAILPLYIVILFMMPALLYLSQRNLILPFAISFGLYVATQVFPAINLPSYPWGEEINYPWGNGWGFNPFAWQFLFFCGMVLGSLARKGAWAVPRIPWLIVLSVVVMLLAFIPRTLSVLDRHDFLALGALTKHLVPQFPFAAKENVGPVRLLHFFFLAYLVAKCTCPKHGFWSTWIARPIVLCGQNSLEIFCLGVMLTHTVGLVMETYSGGSFMLHGLIAAGWLVTIAGAYVLDWKKRAFNKRYA